MEHRPYFVLGDLIACAATGALVGTVCAALFGPGLNMLIAMIAAMALGMALALVLTLALFLWMFGAMEVMVPTMLTGMVVGMAVGMAAAMEPVAIADGASAGALLGIGVLVVTYVANAFLVRRTS